VRSEVDATADNSANRLRHPVPPGPELALDQRQVSSDECYDCSVCRERLFKSEVPCGFPEIAFLEQPQAIVETIVVVGSGGEAGYRVHYEINTQIR
jgi:hypothetical protein